MTEWIEESFTNTIVTAQTMATPVQLYRNDVSLATQRTVVDGYVTIITDTDDLCQVRLYAPVPNFAAAGDFTFATPLRKEYICWYWLNCGRGPMVFRIRSKRTMGLSEEIWGGIVKLRGGNSTEVHVGWQFLLSP